MKLKLFCCWAHCADKFSELETLASHNFWKINPTKSKIRLIFVLALFCRECEFSAKLQLTGKFSAKIQIILNNFITYIAQCNYTHIAVVINNTVPVQSILMSQSEKQPVIVMPETNTMKFLSWEIRPLAIEFSAAFDRDWSSRWGQDWASRYNSGMGLLSRILAGFF